MRRWLFLAVLLPAVVRGVDAGQLSPPPPTIDLQAAAKSVESGDFSAATQMLLALDAAPRAEIRVHAGGGRSHAAKKKARSSSGRMKSTTGGVDG